MKATTILMGCGAIALGACVSQGKYDEAVAETTITRAELNDKNRQLEAANAEAERTHPVYEATVHELQKQIDAGELDVDIRDGRMVLDLRNDVLFETARVDITPAGAKDLDAVADVLTKLPGRRFQVARHTDDELSTARALQVIHYLEDKGVKAAQLSVTGYADGRKPNRRLEITLLPP